MKTVRLEKQFTRDFSLATTEWWRDTLNSTFRKTIGRGYHDYVVVSDGNCLTYYARVQDERALRQSVIERARTRPSVIARIFTTCLRDGKTSQKILDRLSVRRAVSPEELQTVLTRHRLLFPGLRLSLRIPDPWSKEIAALPSGARLIALALKARKGTDGIFEKIDLALRHQAEILLARHSQPTRWAKHVRLSELIRLTAGLPVNFQLISERTQGFLYLHGKITPTKNGLALLKRKRYLVPIENFDQEIITGQVAFRGKKFTGVVRIVNSFEQMRRFKRGEILVSAMTIPPFLPAMIIAKAIVIDEGGVTCHAAIVAREMKKPCIIGTKIATKALKDGDRVEVDANKGVVNKI